MLRVKRKSASSAGFARSAVDLALIPPPPLR